MKFVIARSKKTKQFYFRIIGRNGKKLCHSEGYHNRKDCDKAIWIIKRGAEEANTLVDKSAFVPIKKFHTASCR